MQMVYNSDSYIVLKFDGLADAEPAQHGGFEIVDKLAGRGLYIEGAVAAGFIAGVQALASNHPTPDAFDDFIAGYTLLAQQPVRMH